MTTAVEYGTSWDPKSRAIDGPIPEHEARTRDAAGKPYVVLISVGGQPKALLEVHWRRKQLTVFGLDEHSRRTTEYNYRQLGPDRLHLKHYAEWRYSSTEDAEFSEDGGKFQLRVTPTGHGELGLIQRGSFYTQQPVPQEHHTLRKAGFGAWSAYVDVDVPGGDPTPEENTVDTNEPNGMPPQYIEAMFTPSAQFISDDSTAVISEPQHAGVLQLPTGGVIVTDPGWLDERKEPFTVTVPPGKYPLLVATLRWEGRDEDVTAAAMLQVRDEPTATWEIALLPGQDARALSDDSFYGFGVDSGMGCFVDVSGRGAFEEAYENLYETDSGPDEPIIELHDEATATNLIAFTTGLGDGSYPVWVGRNTNGEITCFVADLLVLRNATPLTPIPPTARHIAPAPPENAEEPTHGNPAAIAEYLATQRDFIVDLRAQIGR